MFLIYSSAIINSNVDHIRILKKEGIVGVTDLEMGGVSIVDGVTGLDVSGEELVWCVLAGRVLADDNEDELALLNLLTLSL
ncbi:hypothetical protein RCL_jg3675.t1 [Rhizophagus clarus]|uniref:Uncharacterized protein n=1 Tax=Rhizophagus clarus TaxID=94130 RepID=A0A8H3QZM5_9GLOM|nr:hypothetical protein RCL_jg3675.t1 [Rhizophagus clarus]